MEHKVFEHKLASGAKGLVLHVPGSKVVNLVITFNSGYQFGDPAFYELPHVLEHLLAGGSSKRFPTHSGLWVELQKNGAFLNAYTSPVSNSYVSEFAAFDLERILDLQRDYFIEQLFREEDLQTEINNVRQELTRNVTDHAHTAYMLITHAAKPHIYMTSPQRLKQLSAITQAATIDYYQKSHTWENMRFYLAGDFPDEGVAAVAKLAARLRGLPHGGRFIPDLTPGGASAPVVEYRPIEQVNYALRWSISVLPGELEAAASVFSALTMQGFGSRIYGNARHAGLAYQLHGGIYWDRGSSELYISGPVTLENVESLFKLIARELAAIGRGDMTDVEVQAAKDLLVGSRIQATQTNGQLLHWYMGNYEDKETIESWDGWNNKLRAVTKEQVIAVAKHVTTGANFGSAFVGPVTQADAQRFAKLLEQISE